MLSQVFRVVNGVALATVTVPAYVVACPCLCCDKADDLFDCVLFHIVVFLYFIRRLATFLFEFYRF